MNSYPREALIERMAAAVWNLHGKPKWDQIPEGWKPFHRDCASAALNEAEKTPNDMTMAPQGAP